MYIEFDLPQGSGGFAAQAINQVINKHLDNWSDQYHIPYKTKIAKYKKRITFDDDQTYAFFALTWNPPTSAHRQWLKYRIVSDLNNKI